MKVNFRDDFADGSRVVAVSTSPNVQTIITPTGPMSIIRSVADRLVQEGLIRRDDDGTLHAADAATVKAGMLVHGVCDFCSAQGPSAAVFDVADFDMLLSGGLSRSTEGWSACPTCADLVRRNRRKDLLARAVSSLAFGTITASAIRELHDRFWRGMARASEGPRPHLPHVVPHWQQALDAKLDAVRLLRMALEVGGLTSSMELRKFGFRQDAAMLPTATVYSFSAETAAAISEAANGIPHDAPLSAVETPTGSGWFWFSEPLSVAASPAASDRTHALLWAWTEGGGRRYRVTLPDAFVDKLRQRPALAKALGTALDAEGVDLIGRALRELGVTQDQLDEWTEEVTEGEPALLFSAFVRDDHTDEKMLLPSTRWYWPLRLSFHDMLAFNAESWNKTYGPGTKHEHDSTITGLKDTLKIIADLSLFFMQACLWFRQTVPVLTQTPGHIERHARKRAQKELRSEEAPIVRVVALRRTAKTEVTGDAPGAEGRAYHCRWIVKGHSRLQACGPGRKDRKLIWIDSYPKGPDDQPLRIKTTVYAVVR